MNVELVMPKGGLTNTEGTLGAWGVEEGSFVKKGDAVLEIENEKTIMEVCSPSDGYLHITVQTGEIVAVGSIMGCIAATKSDYEELKNFIAPASVKEKASQPVIIHQVGQPKFAYVKASPLAKKIALKEALDLALVSGTGPNGRILERDVTKHLKEMGTKHDMMTEEEEPVIIPITPVRKAIAKNMYHSLKSMAQTSDSVEVDVTDLLALRRKLAQKEERLGTRITLNDLLSFATLKMLKAHPLANASMTEDAIVTYPYVNLSMAVATEYGLTSPVIPKADRLSLTELSKSLKDIVTRARGGKLSSAELSGGTFTITNMGIFPVDNFNPIVNPPQSAIIGFGRCVEKPAVYKGEIAIRTMMFLSITYDHRVFDGSEVGNIMKDTKEYLENPELILL